MDLHYKAYTKAACEYWATYMSFAAAGLSVREAGGHAAAERTFDQRSRCKTAHVTTRCWKDIHRRRKPTRAPGTTTHRPPPHDSPPPANIG